MPCKTHIAHIAHIAWARWRVEVQRVGGHIAHIVHIVWSWGSCIAARRPTVRLWARPYERARQGCSVPERGACNDLYAFGRASAWSVPSKGRPRCRELLAVVQGPQTLRHGDCLVGPELSLLAHRVLDTLRRHFHEDRRPCQALASGGRTFAMSSKLWWSFARSCAVMILNVSAGTFTSL